MERLQYLLLENDALLAIITIMFDFSRNNLWLEPFKQDHELSIRRNYLYHASKQVQNDLVLSKMFSDCLVLAHMPNKSC